MIATEGRQSYLPQCSTVSDRLRDFEQSLMDNCSSKYRLQRSQLGFMLRTKSLRNDGTLNMSINEIVLVPHGQQLVLGFQTHTSEVGTG